MHFELKELPTYDLLVMPGGPKINLRHTLSRTAWLCLPDMGILKICKRE